LLAVGGGCERRDYPANNARKALISVATKSANGRTRRALQIAVHEQIEGRNKPEIVRDANEIIVSLAGQ